MEPRKARKPRKPRKPNEGTTEGGKSRKRSLVLSLENDLRLSVLAALRKMNRSALANEILDAGLRGVVAYAPGNPGESPPELSDSDAA